MAVEWTRALTSQLINKVEEKPELWDCNSPIYKDRTRRTNAVKDIAKSLNIPASEVSRKWGIVRSYYVRERRKESVRINGTEHLYISRWHNYDRLRFLNKSISEELQACNGSMVCSTDDILQYEDSQQDEQDCPPLKRERLSTESSDTGILLEKELNETNTNMPKSHKEEEKDDLYHFAKLIETELRKLPADTQLQKKIDLLTVLYNYNF